ncbi:hypothetical protein [Cerasicoccus fimbriatus]|uniref:hypothetical protein n=1 Tax=Cerasicoccus fimbriatus TaxID=3014554 RepID=UPI0022B49881|nr:hypothetical protein [Cerasicoccus sp. TK19100]
MINSYLDMRGKRGPLGFIISFVAIAAVSVLVMEGIYQWLHTNHHLSGLIVFLGILTGVVGASILLTQAIRRLNDMGWNGMYSMLLVFPAGAVALLALYGAKLSGLMIAVVVLGALILAPLCLLPGKKS